MQIIGLAYVVAESRRPESWIEFGERVIGLAARRRDDGGVVLKADERIGRIFVEPGRREGFVASGWEVANEAAFDAAFAELGAAGACPEPVSEAHAHARGFCQLMRFRDPAKNLHELGYGYRSDFERFVSPVGVAGFVMGALGMGHVVLPAPDFAKTQRFFTETMGLGLADLMVHRPGGDAGPSHRIHFLHCGNARHHSVALFEGGVPSGCVHMMLEYRDMDELGRAMDRMLDAGVKLTATLGRHVNDGVTSFYCATPGGFSIELGYGGRLIDWDRHAVFETTRASLWGHDFSLGFNDSEQGKRHERDRIDFAA